ncbi:MAG: hypothetical protein ABWY20_03235 [Mycobacterium sp.]
MSAGDVYTYSPKQHHCMEGLAIENERGKIIDWFWSGDVVGNQVVSPDAEDLTLIANLGDYEMTPRDGRESNEDYAPDDRLVIHSQHGLQRTHYIRKGAKPDLSTKIENARERLEDAEYKARSARHAVEWARDALAELEAQARK